MDPITQEKNVILRLKLDKFTISEDGVDEVVLSRFNNALNELIGGKVVTSYRFQQPIRIALQLKVFYSYEPKFKHYIFMIESTVVILRKVKDQLVLHNSYENAVNFLVEDYRNIGKPQVVISVKDVEEPFVTDCHDDSKLAKSGSKQVQAFASLLLKSNSKKKNAEILLAEKSKLLTKLSMTLAFNCEDEEIISTRDRLVYLREGLASSHVGLLTKGKALTVGEPWLRVHSNYWILGFPVANESNDDLSRFQLYVCHECITNRRTLLFANTPNQDFPQRVYALTNGQLGTVVAVVERPQIVARTVDLNCVANFENSCSREENQCYLGRVTITTSDLFGPTYRITTQKLSSQDFTAIQAFSKLYELPFQLATISQIEFLNSLTHILNFKRVNKHILVVDQLSHSFPCYLVIVNEQVDKLCVFTDSDNDFLLFVRKLIDSFEGSVRFKHPHSDPMLTWNALKKELERIKDVLQQVPTGSSLENVSRELILLESRSANEMALLRMFATL